MTEHENDPRRQPSDADPATAEQPLPAEGPTADPTAADARPEAAAPVTGPPAAAPTSPWQQQGYGHPQPPYTYPPQPGAPYTRPAPGWHDPQQQVYVPGRAPIAGAPVPTPAPGGPGTPGGPAGPPPPWSGNEPPAWAQPAPARRPVNRGGKWVAAGVAAVALMLGSAVAGGATAVALFDNNGSTAAQEAAAAPVINRSSLAEISKKVEPSVVSITTGSGEGSGVVMSEDGYILTNNHVVASAQGDTVTVVFDNGKSARATIIGTDPKTDLAVVKAEGVSGLAAATFGDSGSVQVGDTVLAIGSPLGLQGSVTAGIISAKDRTIRTGGDQQDSPFPSQQQQSTTSLSGLLQTDAPINPGNSGGALVNTNGEVIGINSAIATSGQGSGNIGVGFAIPSNKAKDVADTLRSGGKVSHPVLGVSVSENDSGAGALVSAVTANSPAAQAGLQQGDVVTEFDGQAINDSDALVAAVQSHKVGDKVELKYTRDGAEKTATVTLAEAS
jgi:putative serine protease PepD